MIIFEEIEGKPDLQKLAEIKSFYHLILNETDAEKFDLRIGSVENLFIVLAYSEDEIVGFKLGYQLDEIKFYSWIGGVKSEFRQKGIAQELMTRQHNWCKMKGFQTVQTKTFNRFKPMLILNIKNGFDVIELQSSKQNEIKIVLEKVLKD